MNRRREPVSARVQKKSQKEVKKGNQKTTFSTILSPEEAKKIEHLHPKKKKLHKTACGNLSKTIARKTAYPHHKLSKRTNTEDKTIESVPAHVHREDRWIRTSQKQSVLRGKRLTRKLYNKTK